ncbi:MAG TPA: D-alanine--D-alanine ligase family protein [Bryobacteraceae bacterium]|nr:D-alanine--D-alanine ligase family protein [Bryobacteraceae bacterium]
MKKTIAIIFGGRSGEHEISIRSAESIMSALDPERYHIVKYFISKDGRWSPRPVNPEPGRNPEIDVVFPVLHGTFGEDGTVQGLLELADLPYVSAGVLASAAGMDKEIAKRLMRDRGLPVVEHYLACDGAANPFGYPVFVKPANLGSSVGISKASNEQELAEAIALARQYDHKVLVERGIIGQEIECSVLGNEDPLAATPCEVLPSREFYDYDDKYVLDKAQFRMPPTLPPEKIEEVRRLAVECFRALECEIMARVDFLYEKSTGRIYINEINTIPGFTSISMYPKMWEHAGLPYSKLLDRLIELALERQQRRRALKYSR